MSKHRLKKLSKIFGPGIVTGASDDDPSGIATYTQAGAQYGTGALWFSLFIYPLAATVQEMCGRIGLLTGSGLAGVIKKKYSKKTVLPIITLLLVANTINIGADIGAMSASVNLIFPGFPILLVTLLFTATIILSEILIPYQKYIRILKYLTLSLLAYFITAIIIGGNWQEIFTASIIPHIEFTPAFSMMFVALFGTTISPYLFFWQTSEEAEEDVAKNKINEIGEGKPHITKREIKMMRMDVMMGMGFAQITMWFIIMTAAGTLHTNGVTDIITADQAAKALEPLVQTFPNSGQIAKTIFALGVIGTGMLAIPILSGSSAYALSEGFGWKQGLSKKFKEAKSFYLIIASSTVVGLWINFMGLDPIRALFYTAIINGIIAVPLLIAVIKVANDNKILHTHTNRKLSNVLGWVTVAIMGFSIIIMIFTWM
ncbi:iron transporter [Nitrosopumilaceae archaeon]|nr:divalent metal cation transporter MntH [Nitrosarchaeum sp.]GDY15169.1 iron transporter [Nitrosopumilaceae archaeon]